MTPSQLMFIIATVCLLAVGQVLFKLASASLVLTASGFVASLFDPKLIAALVVYAVATVMWLIALKSSPLRVAYPFVAMAFFIVPVLAHFILDEPLGWNTFAGAALIAAGVWVSVLR